MNTGQNGGVQFAAHAASVTRTLGDHETPASVELAWRTCMEPVGGSRSYQTTWISPVPSTATAGMNCWFVRTSFTNSRGLHVSPPLEERLKNTSHVPIGSFAVHTVYTFPFAGSAAIEGMLYARCSGSLVHTADPTVRGPSQFAPSSRDRKATIVAPRDHERWRIDPSHANMHP